MILSSKEVIPVIMAGLERGQKVRLTVNGSSMVPFINNEDIIELEPAKTLRFGDIVLAEPSAGRYVIHRIVKVGSDSFWLQGDTQTKSEGPISIKAVLGKATLVKHDGRVRHLEKGLWRVAGIIWAGTRPSGAFLCSYLLFLRRIFSRLLKLF